MNNENIHIDTEISKLWRNYDLTYEEQNISRDIMTSESELVRVGMPPRKTDIIKTWWIIRTIRRIIGKIVRRTQKLEKINKNRWNKWY